MADTTGTYLVKATWLTFLEDDTECIEVEASSDEEAKRAADPRISELSKSYGKGPSLVGIEERPRPQ